MTALIAGPGNAQGVAVAAQEQVTQIDRRVGALERQMRAVQREVFPGGDKRFFAPEVTAAPDAGPAQAGTPASSPLVDLTQRLETLEEQQRQLTGQIETLEFQIRQLQAELAKARQDTEFRLNALEGGGGSSSAPASAAPPALAPPTAAAAPPRTTAPTTAAPPSTTGPLAAAPTPPGPASGLEAGEAAYRAAYALFQAGDDAGAQKAFADFLASHRGHPRSSHASYWSGRSQMRQNQPALAAKTFLSTYQQFPKGERAPNALLWLGKALTQMKRPEAACQALDELRQTYADKLTGALLTESNAARAAAKCGA
jgi:TolA-binding protein